MRLRHSGRLAATAAIILLSLASLPRPAASAAAVGTAVVSGLDWRSGASADPGFGTWRGRPMDVRVAFLQHGTWDQMLNQARGGFFRSNCTQTPLCVVSMALFPESNKGAFQPCAGGAFDASHRQLAGLLAAARKGAFVRLGWEANSSGSHAWRIGTAANIPAYKACFRRLASVYHAAGLRIDWTVAKGGTVDAYSTYPGDDVVDVWGLHYYDSGKGTPDQEAAAWLARARSHGKLIGFGEWGLWQHGDDPTYIQSMFAFFKAHAASIAYENYYNKNPAHQLWPTTRFPRSAAAYKAMWGRG